MWPCISKTEGSLYKKEKQQEIKAYVCHLKWTQIQSTKNIYVEMHELLSLMHISRLKTLNLENPANKFKRLHEFLIFNFQVDFILMLLVMWVQAVKNVQTVPLSRMIRPQELELRIASHVP